MEENTKLGVQMPVVGCSVANTEMGACGPAGQMGPCCGVAWASVETKKAKKWAVAGKNIKSIINTFTQQKHTKENIMLVTENNKSKEICS